MESLSYNFSFVRLMVFEIQIVAHLTKSSGIYFYQFFSVCLWTSIYKYKLELKYNIIVEHKGTYLMKKRLYNWTWFRCTIFTRNYSTSI